MNKADEIFLCEGDIFAPLIAGLSSDNSAIRSAAVHHAFRSMDRAAATGTTYGASIVQSLCDIVVTHMYVESDSRARPPESGHGGFDQKADFRITGHRSSNTAGARYLHQECRRTVL